MKMQLIVRELWKGGKTRTLDVDPDDTVYSVMAQIEDATGFPPIVQMITFGCKVFFCDTPGTLAENKLVVPSSADIPASVTVNHSGLTWTFLRIKTLSNLGFSAVVDDGEELDPSKLQLSYPGQEKMFISVMDHIRMDKGEKLMVLAVEAGDTVANLKEQVQRRRRYPVAMQEITVSDADDPDKARRMDRLDATLADYERGKVFNKAEAKEIAAPGEQEQVSNSSSISLTTKSDPAGSVYDVVFCLFTGAVVIVFIAMVLFYLV